MWFNVPKYRWYDNTPLLAVWNANFFLTIIKGLHRDFWTGSRSDLQVDMASLHSVKRLTLSWQSIPSTPARQRFWQSEAQRTRHHVACYKLSRSPGNVLSLERAARYWQRIWTKQPEFTRHVRTMDMHGRVVRVLSQWRLSNAMLQHGSRSKTQWPSDLEQNVQTFKDTTEANLGSFCSERWGASKQHWMPRRVYRV
jgi:hypothetical protein